MDVFTSLIRLKIIPFLERWNLVNVILGAIDILAIAFAFQLAFLLNYYGENGFFFFQRSDLTLDFPGNTANLADHTIFHQCHWRSRVQKDTGLSYLNIFSHQLL